MTKESSVQWRPVFGYEGLYEVSSRGDVRSVDRVVYQLNRGGVEVPQLYAGRLLSPFDNGRGYLVVGLWKDGCRKQQPVHRLVAGAFIGPCPDGMEVCHGDGNRQNNAIANLRYGTVWENGQDRIRHGRSRPGSKSHLAKLTEETVIAIRNLSSTMSRRQLSEKFSVPESNLGFILRRRTWRHC